MDAREFNAQLLAVAAEMSATEFFDIHKPENDLHPDPRALRDEIVQLRNRVSRLEKNAGLADFKGIPNVITIGNRSR